VWRDIIPEWLAGDPPRSEALLLKPGENHYVQVGIFDAAGHTIGRSWTNSNRIGREGLVLVLTTTVLQPIHLPGGVTTPRVRIETKLSYAPEESHVEELFFWMHGLGVPVSLKGAAMPSGEFPCKWQVGSQRGAFVLDTRAPAALGDVIRPFHRLPDLYVGRTWRIKLLDPLSNVLPNLEAAGLSLEPILVRVTRTEMITHDEERIRAFVVEGGGATAWVAPDGRVLRQEVQVPLFGTLVLLEEPYDEEARDSATRSVRSERQRTRDNPAGEDRP